MKINLKIPHALEIPALSQAWEFGLGQAEVRAAMRVADELGYHKAVLGEHFKGVAEFQALPDSTSNALLISGSPAALDEVVKVLDQLDHRPQTVSIEILIAEIAAALDGRWAHEIIYVNDGSTDATAERLAAQMKQRGNLRQLRHATSSGQSAAVRSGVRAARGAIVATLDGDGQNNPAFLPDLFSAIERGGDRVGLAAGQRVGRKDTGFKKIQSRIANGVRNAVLKQTDGRQV